MTLGIADKMDEKIQFIMTSASLGNDNQQKKEFIKGLTGREEAWFQDERTEFIDGTPWKIPEEDDALIPLDRDEWYDALESVDINAKITKFDRHFSSSIRRRVTWRMTRHSSISRNHQLYKFLYDARKKPFKLTILRIISLLTRPTKNEIVTELILNFIASLQVK